MSERDDLNAARGILRGLAYSVLVWVLIAVCLAVLAGCAIPMGRECERYTMQGECERPFFEQR
jgi:hypothetical protein